MCSIIGFTAQNVTKQNFFSSRCLLSINLWLLVSGSISELLIMGSTKIPAEVKTTSESYIGVEADDQLYQFGEGRSYDAAYDKRDMFRLGRKQVMKRRFRFFSIVGYMVILASTWESVLVASIFSLPNGGRAGTVWLTLIASCGMLTSMLSMAEVSSIA